MILKFNNQWLEYDKQTFCNFAEPIRYVYTGANVTATPTSGIYDTLVDLTHTTPQGYDFVDYSVTGATLNDDSFKIQDSDVYVEGNYVLHKYTVTTQSTNGSVTASPNKGVHGTIVTLSNTPASGYAFDYYEVTGATLINDNQFVIGYSNVTVIGHFKSAVKHATVHLRLPTIADTLTESGTTWYPYLIGQTWVVVSHTGDDISELIETGNSSRIYYADGALGGSNSIERFTTGTILRKLDNVQAVVHATGDSSDWAYEVRARSNIQQDVIYLSEYNGQTEEWALHQVNPRNTQDAAGCWNYGRGQGVVAYTGPLSQWWQFNVSVGYNIDGNKYCMPNPSKSYKDVIVDLTWT
jgi:hypothetical protein